MDTGSFLTLFKLLNNDPYQVKRTAECIHCSSYSFICLDCGHINSTDQIIGRDKIEALNPVFQWTLVYFSTHDDIPMYSSHTKALVKLISPELAYILTN